MCLDGATPQNCKTPQLFANVTTSIAGGKGKKFEKRGIPMTMHLSNLFCSILLLPCSMLKSVCISNIFPPLAEHQQ
jgi:hypothetical protein